MRSIVTGDSKILSGVLEAEITTSPPNVTEVPSSKEIPVVLPVICFSCRPKPMLLATSVKGSFAEVVNVNTPALFVEVPPDCPTITTLALTIGSLVSLSITVPLTVWVWACSVSAVPNSKNAMQASRVKTLIIYRKI